LAATPLETLPPDLPRAAARVHLRFEDVTQDGRLVLEALPNALGPTVWRGIVQHDPGAAALFARGIVPILSRFVLSGGAGPFSSSGPFDAEGAMRLARSEDGRYVVDMWADLYGAVGRTYGSTGRDGARALAGHVFAEHVLTRPFAPAGERRVTRLDFEGAPRAAEGRPASPAPEAIASVPAGARPLEPELSPDEVPLVFGTVHTDSNRHVNSLVYLRVFEEAALRRFARLGRGAAVLGRSIDIAYRKPCFAGQVMRVLARAFEEGDRLGVAAVLVPDADPSARGEAKPHVYARMTFEA